MKEVDSTYSDDSDKFKHCLVSCRAAQECGLASVPGGAGPAVLMGGALWEIFGGVFDLGDMAANIKGTLAGSGFGNCCEERCARHYGAPGLK